MGARGPDATLSCFPGAWLMCQVWLIWLIWTLTTVRAPVPGTPASLPQTNSEPLFILKVLLLIMSGKIQKIHLIFFFFSKVTMLKKIFTEAYSSGIFL